MTFVQTDTENAATGTRGVWLREGVMTMADHEEMRDMVEGNPGEAMTHSAPIGDPTMPGTGARHLSSRTPENADGEINPSAPGETGITPRSDR